MSPNQVMDDRVVLNFMKTYSFAFFLIGLSILNLSTIRADHSPGVFGGGAGGPINTIPGTVLERRGVAMSYRYDFLDLKQFSDQQLLDFENAGFDAHSTDTTHVQFATLAYGVTDKLTLAIRQPYISQVNLREPDGFGGIESLGSSSGFADTQLFAFRRLIKNDARKFYVSGLFGFDVPTGRTNNVTNSGSLFETEHQPGSGSLDPIIGLNMTKNFKRFSSHTSVSRIFNTLGSQQTTLGGVFNYNTAIVYRLKGHSFCRKTDCASNFIRNRFGDSSVIPASYHEGEDHSHSDSVAHSHEGGHDEDDHQHGPMIDLICEFNGIHQGKHDVAGDLNTSSGGQLIYVSPGVRLTLFDHWATFLQGGLPIYQQVNGANHEVNYRLTLGTAYFY